MIDEKKLIEDIRKCDRYVVEFGEEKTLFDMVLLDDVKSIINRQPKVDWIPYTTNCELPYNGQKVWLSFSNELCSYVKQAWWIYDHFEWNNGKRVKDYPLAWMPYIVPQPYKKEGAENG